MEVEWPKVFFGEAFYGQLQAEINKKMIDEVTAEQAFNFVLDKVSHNNWEKCAAFKGMSKPETFLFRICRNLALDYSRSIDGRPRPNKWIRDNGPLWEEIWEDLCVKRKDPNEVVHKQLLDGSLDEEAIRGIITVIKTRLPKCGERKVHVNIDDPDFPTDSVEELATSGDCSDCNHEEQELTMISTLLGEDVDLHQLRYVDEAKLCEIRSKIRELGITSEERIILQLFYVKGKNYTAIARQMGLEKHQPVRLIERTLKKVRQLLPETD